MVAAYVLTFAGLMFLGGRLADRWGRRRTFVVGLAVFALASAAAAAAVGPASLVAARAVQGVGGALLLPAALSILGADLGPRARRVGAGVATAGAAAALALGPVVGGALTEHVTWHAIFLVNLPIAAACLALTGWAVPPSRGVVVGPLGLAGIVTAGLTVAAVVWLLIEGAHGGPAVTAVAAVGAVAAGWCVHLVRRGRATVVDAVLARNRRFVGAVLTATLWGLGVNGVFFFTSLYLQGVLGVSPTAAGAVFVPLALGVVVMVAAVEPVLAWLGARVAVAGGLVLVAVGFGWVSVLGAQARAVDLVAPFVVVGVGSGLTVPLTALALGAVDTARMGMASSLVTAGRELAGALGVAGIGAVVAARQAALHGAGAAERLAFLGGVEWGLRTAAGVMVVAAVVAATTLPARAQRGAAAPS